ncbi:MAG: alcohol dehydrogenase [Candidatus Latescibacterota bacterium]|nr:MAG: alcohol dehydrogenase [Candidatus Latescibacterota bacterium]RKY73867.1 MAG: alcohol dehydrogenase [Candidatus Latescibacterota bacterium]
MLQATMIQPGKIVFNDVPKPRVEPREVLIEVKACGICGSDVHVWRGEHPFTSYPIVQGHEFAGVVASVGKDAVGPSPGRKVTVEPSIVCGKCYPCRHGKYNICDNLKVMGFQTDGCHRNFFAVPARNVIPLPDEMSFEAGAMVEPTAVGVHAVKKAALKEGNTAIILGAGPIGLLTMQAAKGLGASRIMITDVVDFRLKAAERLGADCVVNAQQEDVSTAVRREFGKDGADLIFECVGAEQTLETAIQTARKGSKIIVVGVIGGRPRLSIGLLQDRELEMTGTLMYVREDFLLAIELIRSGKVTPKEMITSRFKFEDLPQAYREADEKKDRNIKVMVEF